MFDDYYSFHPTIQLQSSIFVTGFFGTPVATSTRFVQALSGVQVVDVERLLEHRLGERLAHYLCKYQKDDLYRLEYGLLQQVLNEQPSIVVLRPSTLKYRRSFDLLSSQKGLALLQSLRTYLLGCKKSAQQRTERLVDLDCRLPISDVGVRTQRWLFGNGTYLPLGTVLVQCLLHHLALHLRYSRYYQIIFVV